MAHLEGGCGRRFSRPGDTEHGGGAGFESADRKYLYFTSTSGSGPLFRMPVAGGPEVEVAPKVLYWGSFSITGKGGSFLAG